MKATRLQDRQFLKVAAAECPCAPGDLDKAIQALGFSRSTATEKRRRAEAFELVETIKDPDAGKNGKNPNSRIVQLTDAGRLRLTGKGKGGAWGRRAGKMISLDQVASRAKVKEPEHEPQDPLEADRRTWEQAGVRFNGPGKMPSLSGDAKALWLAGKIGFCEPCNRKGYSGIHRNEVGLCGWTSGPEDQRQLLTAPGFDLGWINAEFVEDDQ